MKSRGIPYATAFALFMIFSYAVFLLLDKRTVHMLAREDGFFEYFGAICLFIGSAFLFILFWKYSSGNDLLLFKTRKNYFILMLAILFFFGAGEEISWGQRIFGLKTPKFLASINEQKEINIHNIELFDNTNLDNVRESGLGFILGMDFLFSLFWFSYGVVIPFVNRVSPRARAFLKRINLPVLPIWAGVLFLTVYGISKIMESSLTGQLQNNLIEVKECDLEVLLGVVSVYLFTTKRRARISSSQPKESVR